MAECVISAQKLTKFYGKARGIEDLDLQVEQGEVFGFIGPNGAGKSTTIRLILSLIRPTSGSVSVFGLDSAAHNVQILREVGYLPSEVYYYDKMRVGDLLNYSARFYKKDCSARIKELCGIMDLDVHRRIEELSYGNKKKVGIVQGLLHSPKLIILDEPTGGLDPLMQKTFFDLIQSENQRGTTVVFSSHILSEVQRLCDRVAIIKDGHIIRNEKIADMTGNTYKRVHIEFDGALPDGFFDRPGISSPTQTGTEASFIFNGEIAQLLSYISGLTLRNLNITEPDLEEIFMHFYG